MYKEVLTGLMVNPDGIYVDATFGRGGHSRGILSVLNEKGRLLVMDRDPEAIKVAKSLPVSSCQEPFSRLKAFCDREGVTGRVSGVLFDLGVCSTQLDDPQRGFSFLQDGPLDMRMDPSVGENAAEWLARAKADEIADVLYHYGEERYSRRIARAIVQAREEKPITRTEVLAEIIKKAHPAWEKHKHPATRAFQAIRIFINQELSEIDLGLEQALDVLMPTGRLVVISFHSLEDRKVKQFIHRQERGEEFPMEVPVLAEQVNSRLRRVGKAQKPSEKEVAQNVRARSAILRIAEKVA